MWPYIPHNYQSGIGVYRVRPSMSVCTLSGRHLVAAVSAVSVNASGWCWSLEHHTVVQGGHANRKAYIQYKNGWAAACPGPLNRREFAPQLLGSESFSLGSGRKGAERPSPRVHVCMCTYFVPYFFFSAFFDSLGRTPRPLPLPPSLPCRGPFHVRAPPGALWIDIFVCLVKRTTAGHDGSVTFCGVNPGVGGVSVWPARCSNRTAWA